MSTVLLGVISGAVSGLAYGLSGYKESGQPFKWVHFLEGVLPALAVGTLAGYTGDPFLALFGGPTGVGIKTLVKKLILLIPAFKK